MYISMICSYVHVHDMSDGYVELMDMSVAWFNEFFSINSNYVSRHDCSLCYVCVCRAKTIATCFSIGNLPDSIDHHQSFCTSE